MNSKQVDNLCILFKNADIKVGHDTIQVIAPIINREHLKEFFSSAKFNQMVYGAQLLKDNDGKDVLRVLNLYPQLEPHGYD